MPSEWETVCREVQGEYSNWAMVAFVLTVSHAVVVWGTVLYYKTLTGMPSMHKYKVRLPEGNRTNKESALRHAVIDAIIASFVTVPIAASLVGWLFGADVCEELPSWEQTALQLCFHMVFTDTTFYWAHRTLHTKWFYARIHKQHHEFKTLDPICAEYDHPVEDLINVLSTAGGPILLDSHPCVLMVHVSLRLMQSIDAHSGYSLPLPYSVWNVGPFWSSSVRHSYHHGVNVGNYGDWFPFWDWLCGTDKSWRDFYFQNNDKSVKTE
eukprot:TRINITY_DN3648_c0_g2_i1.p1 TRINITY_DN3648_c0_g2~~TRINITY_DN3648_c0_g2_i1.p1  ORF type:complete len:267 (+),score=29.48 TRINITY_DN3648_c0_g2_i1:64-864(+)